MSLISKIMWFNFLNNIILSQYVITLYHSINSTTVYLLFQNQFYTPNVTVTGGIQGAKNMMKIFITP